MKFIMVLLVFSFLPVLALNEHDFSEAKALLEQQPECSSLSTEQLELIGDYYMEQMHPGEAHELMDKMMGGEGSLQLQQVHVSLARRFYCNENDVFGQGMMMGYNTGMMGGARMGTMMGNTGMMGTWGYGGVFSTLYLLLMVALIVLVILGIVFLWKKVNLPKNR